MSRCLSPPLQAQHEARRAVILSWQADAEFAQSEPNPLKRKRRNPLATINSNMDRSPNKRRAKKAQENDGKEDVTLLASADAALRAPSRRSSRSRSQEMSPTRQSTLQQHRLDARPTLDGIFEDGNQLELPMRGSSYVNTLQSGLLSHSESSLSTISKRTSRASSPVKKKADLRLGKVELDYKGSIQERTKNLPQDAHDLYTKLESICVKYEVIPMEIKDMIERKEMLLPHMVRAENNQNNRESQNTRAEMTREYGVVQTILRNSLDCLRREKHEPAWNEEVHRMVLDLAFSTLGNDEISVDNVTLAQISPDFVPEAASDKARGMQSKVVDYTLNLILPDAYSPDIYKFFASLPYNQHSLNQTVYTAVRERPAAVSIETKVDNPSDPINQLAIWSSAWHNRIRRLVGDARIVTLPLITIGKDGWKVSFFCDCGDKVEIWDLPDVIGHTKTAIGVYMLLAGLRAIGEWITTTYKDWFWESVWPKIEVAARSGLAAP